MGNYIGREPAYGYLTSDKFAGNGTTTTFALTYNPGSVEGIYVHVAGAPMIPGIDYTLSAQNIVFSVAPPLVAGGETYNILVAYQATQVQVGSTSAANIVVTPSTYLTETSGQSALDGLSNRVGRKNAVINGNFDIWQRQITFTTPTSNVYTADRWNVTYDGTIGTFTLSQQLFSLGQTAVPGEPAFYLQWNQTVAGSTSTIRTIQQRIESVRSFAGQTCTLSFWAQTDIARNITPTLTQVFGTGGSPSGVVATVGSVCSCTNTWTKFTQTFTIPSITGKTLGTTYGSDFLQLNFQLPINTTMTINISQVQLELGSIPTPFEKRPLYDEFRSCQRYYEKSYDPLIYPGASGSAIGLLGYAMTTGLTNSSVIHAVRFSVTKRVDPTVTAYSNNGTVGKLSDASNIDLAASSAVAGFVGTSGYNIVNSSGGTLSSNIQVFHHFTADAEL